MRAAPAVKLGNLEMRKWGGVRIGTRGSVTERRFSKLVSLEIRKLADWVRAGRAGKLEN